MLGAATVIIAVLTAALYRKRKDIGFLIGIGALYYWTLYGAWYIIVDKTGNTRLEPLCVADTTDQSNRSGLHHTWSDLTR